MARRAGVGSILIPSLDHRSWSAVRACAAAGGWRFALGTHPWSLAGLAEDAPLLPDDLGGAAAVGECGLDGGIAVPMARQVAALRAQSARARAAGLPVVLHAVRCHDRLPGLLAEIPVRGVLHSYSGGPELVAAYLGLGMYLSFGPIILDPRARRPILSLQRVPADRLLLESDGPSRGAGPERLPEILAAAARIRGEDPGWLAARLWENGERLFGGGGSGRFDRGAGAD